MHRRKATQFKPRGGKMGSDIEVALGWLAESNLVTTERQLTGMTYEEVREGDVR